MAVGAVGQLAGVAMGLAGLVGIVRARRAGRSADRQDDAQLAGRLEMERRMQAYLAARDDTKTGASDERR